MKSFEEYRRLVTFVMPVLFFLTVFLPGCFKGDPARVQQDDGSENILEFDVIRVSKREMARDIE
ncbi:hypothetical protein LCGC14_2434670, partial [marine sediment metagenome]